MVEGVPWLIVHPAEAPHPAVTICPPHLGQLMVREHAGRGVVVPVPEGRELQCRGRKSNIPARDSVDVHRRLGARVGLRGAFVFGRWRRLFL